MPDLLTALAAIPGLGTAMPYLTALAAAYGAVVSVCSTLATRLPAPDSPTGFYAGFYWMVNLMALNVAHATNLTSPAVAGLVAGPTAIENPQVAITVRPFTLD